MQIIDPYSFSGCTSLQSVNLSGCVGLRLDENVDYNIGTYAFENCTSLRKVDLSGCVNLDTGSIADFTFSGCGLTNIIIPKSSTGHPHPILGFAENVGNAKVLVSGNTETGEYVFTNRTKVIGSLAYGEVDLSN
ncbi:MAG: leucine-rich repeat domain-containing protein [Mycoplasmoidaceae bacterium]|nr:leucine-rich repeat domain-containing protein [Mycoplasmoidaceae bacterium]